MNAEAHQPEQTTPSNATNEPDDETGPNGDEGVVIAFPTRPDTNPPDETDGEEPWKYRVDRRGGGLDFTAHITYVDGAEGERLRRELAAVTRELLVWATERKRDRDRDGRRDGSAAAGHAREDRAA